MTNAATLSSLGVSLISIVRHTLGGLHGYVVNSVEDTVEYVSECYDGAGDLTPLEAANAAAHFATNGTVTNVAGLLG